MAEKAAKKEKVVPKFWETKKAFAMATQYEKGKTIKELSEKYGITTSLVSKTLKTLGVETRPRGRRA